MYESDMSQNKIRNFYWDKLKIKIKNIYRDSVQC